MFKRAPMLNPKNAARRSAIRGQGMGEYVIVVILVALTAIGLVGLFGNNIRALFGSESEALAGHDNVGNGGKQPAPVTRGSLAKIDNSDEAGPFHPSSSGASSAGVGPTSTSEDRGSLSGMTVHTN